jgi:hypothetical protein
MIPSWAHSLKIFYRESRIKGDELFVKTCPYCTNSHWNFQISFTLCTAHCWVCGKGVSVKTLLYENQIAFEDEDIQPKTKEKAEEKELILPKGKPLWLEKSKAAQMAKSYFAHRGILERTIQEWEVYLATGEDADKLEFDYFGYVIVPFYGLKGLEYFMAARYKDGRGYKLPDISKDKFVPKKKGSDSIVLVEGLFDAMTVWQFTQYDVLMLAGTYLLQKQSIMLEKTNYKTVYVCLDGDALNSALKMCWRLYRAGINNLKLVKLPVDKDPNDLGIKVLDYIYKAENYVLTTSIGEKILRIKSKGCI